MSITAGQTSVLTLTAPAGQAIATSNLTVSAAATVDGLPATQSAPAALSVVAPTTTLLGRTVVSDSLETLLAGVTITTLGKDGNGNTTGCAGFSTTSDAAGNFALTNLPLACTGPQLIGFDGTTATAPPGKYAGVNLVFTLNSGQVTVSPVLVHLPRIDNVETFLVTQNSSSNQSYSFVTIPGLSVTVYAGTTFTMPDGTQPNPFPLAAVQVPVDRLPDAKPFVPTMMRVFIVAFQPANATASQPVAVYFPNTINTPPGSDMALMTLDPTRGTMVPYGTGAVSPDGSQIVPDPDPGRPGHLYGLVNFDWHGPMPAPKPQPNPGPPGGRKRRRGGPASGPGGGPGGGTGPGGGNGGNNGGTGGGGGTGTGGSGGNGNGNNGNGRSNCGSCPCPVAGIPKFSTDAEIAVATPPPGPWSITQPGSALGQSDPPAQAGDPVDLYSGIMTISNTDISIPGARGSLAVTRTYRSLTTQGGPFGVGTDHNYNYGLDTAFPNTTAAINLIMPDGNRFPFALRACPQLPQIIGVIVDAPPCTPGITNATIPAFAGAVMTIYPDSSTDLRWKDGTVWHFLPINFQFGSLLSSITDSNGNTITVSRNGPLVTSVADPVGRSLTFAYDASNRITSITDPIGRVVKYTYNAQGTLASFTDAAGGVTSYTYDANNNMLTMTDARGIVQAQNTLDSQGRVIKQVRPDGGTLTFTYQLLNPLVPSSQVVEAQVTDSQGVQSRHRFNASGFVTDESSTQGQAAVIFRDGGNFPKMVTEASSTEAYTYDSRGNLASYTDPTGQTTKFTYDPTFNKVTSITDPLGNVSSFVYDTRGNLATATDADSNSTSYQYDATGLLTQVTDAVGHKTILTYDSSGNLASVSDPLGNTTSYVSDAISRLIATQDNLGRRASFTYDPLGRLLSQTDANGGVTQYTYDLNANLLTIRDSRNNATSFTYDVMNRLATRTDALGKTDTRRYDTNGNLIEFTDRRGQTGIFAYDNLNRLATETYSDAIVDRSYNALGHLAQVNDSASGLFAFSYDLAGRLLTASSPTGTVTYTYDSRGAMVTHQVNGQPVLTYSYDAVGNLASAMLAQASATFSYDQRNHPSAINRANGVSTNYTYDADARVASVTHTKSGTTIDAETYTYDAVGNRINHVTNIAQPLVTQPTVNQYNTANRLTLFSGSPNLYDANGNLIQDGTATYTWDARNRLKSINAGGQTTNFLYDFGRNLIQEIDTGATVNLTTSFVLDSLTNVAFESDSDGSSYDVLTGRSIDSHLAIVQPGGQAQYGLSDATNSTVSTVDQAGAVKSQFLYEPFGQTSTTGVFPFQFTGRMPVSRVLYYYRTRFYSTMAGRFIAEDSLFQTNAYRYASNRPTSLRDPFGLQDIANDFEVKVSDSTPNVPYALPTPYTPSINQTFPDSLPSQNISPLPPYNGPSMREAPPADPDKQTEEYMRCILSGKRCLPDGQEVVDAPENAVPCPVAP
jgi:RHS repeat-associated protein